MRQAMHLKIKNQSNDIKQLLQEIGKLKAQDREAKRRFKTYESKLEPLVEQLRGENRKLKEENLILQERNQEQHELILKLTGELDEKGNRIFVLEQRFHDSNTTIEKLRQMTQNMTNMEQELMVWERNHDHFVNEYCHKTKLEEELRVRSMEISALKAELQVANERIHSLESELLSSTELLNASMMERQKVQMQAIEIEENRARQNALLSASKTKIHVLKEANLALQNRLLQLQAEAEERDRTPHG